MRQQVILLQESHLIKRMANLIQTHAKSLCQQGDLQDMITWWVSIDLSVQLLGVFSKMRPLAARKRHRSLTAMQHRKKRCINIILGSLKDSLILDQNLNQSIFNNWWHMLHMTHFYTLSNWGLKTLLRDPVVTTWWYHNLPNY